MITAIQRLYDQLFIANPKSIRDELSSGYVAQYLIECIQYNPGEGIYRDLLVKIRCLKTKMIPPMFIELYCLGKLSDHILTVYPVNIAEAFIMAYVLLNRPVELQILYFKIGTSGLLAPSLINGEKITDSEAVAAFLIKSLVDAELIKITDNNYVVVGKCFALDF